MVGEAEAILAKAKATADGLEVISRKIRRDGGLEAAALRIAEQYMEARPPNLFLSITFVLRLLAK